MVIRTIAKCAVALWVLAAPATGLQAQVESIDAKITRTLVVADDDWGGCAVSLSVSPADEGLPNCSKWVTFSCSGVHASKSNALRMFDSAQMAFALGKTVRVWVDDQRTHNGFCFVERIDVLAS